MSLEKSILLLIKRIKQRIGLRATLKQIKLLETVNFKRLESLYDGIV